MSIVVRNMVYSDIEELSKAFAGQGWTMPKSVFEEYYNRMARRCCDILVAEARGRHAGFARLEWVDAGDGANDALIPEIQEFIILSRFSGMGVADAMSAELERRIAARIDSAENAMMAIYEDAGMRPATKCSYVLDGLLVGNDGKFARSAGPSGVKGIRVTRRNSR